MTNRAKRPFRIIIPVLALALAWLVFAPQAAFAQTSTQEAELQETRLEQYGISCAEELCTVEISLDRLDLTPIATYGASFAIEVLQENLNFLPEGAGITIDDDLTLQLPVGDLQLADADLVLTMNESGQIDRLRGTAEVSVPSFALPENIDMDAPLRADLGLESGENLAHLQAPLDDERRYLFLDFHSGFTGTSPDSAGSDESPIAVTVPRGQDATLIIDPLEPYAYLAGNVSFSMADQIELVGQLVDLGGAEALLPDGLPIRERVGLQMATSIGKGATPFFTAGGAYSVDAGMIGNLIGIELMPLAAQGTLTLEQAGLLLDGIAESRIAPNVLFNGSAGAAFYLPFSRDFDTAYAQLDAEAEIPFAATTVEATARLDGTDGILAQATVTTPLSNGDDLVFIADPSTDSNRIPLVRSLADGASNTATRSYLYVRNGTTGGLETLSNGADMGVDWSQRTWCGVTGRCDQPVDAVAVAN